MLLYLEAVHISVNRSAIAMKISSYRTPLPCIITRLMLLGFLFILLGEQWCTYNVPYIEALHTAFVDIRAERVGMNRRNPVY